jgi:fatty-acyl-CoA synthase
MAVSSAESSRSPLKAWVRALERTAAIERNPHLTLPLAVDALAERFASAPALVSPQTTLSYRSLAQSASRYARWALAEGLRAGDTVCLLMHNCPDYLAIWLGLTRAGVTVALLNTHLTGAPLAHCIRIAGARGIIAGSGFGDRIRDLRSSSLSPIACWAHGTDEPDFPRMDSGLAAFAGEPVTATECALPSLSDRALYIYTSGTTGLPKAAIVSHHRLMQWSHWFAGLMDITPADRLYDCLPMYHSVGGVVATGATLVGGGAVVLRERFSASHFWQDIREQRCTIFQYIGELCRYLVNSADTPGRAPGGDGSHSLRLACGNGLRAEVWKAFQARFGIPQILEYYAATEGTFSLYNCEGRPGSIGRIPPFLSHRYPVALVRADAATGMPARDAAGRCVPCGPGEIGEAIGRIAEGNTNPGARFEGYADADATRAKVLRDVFTPGDAWYRTGDLMSRDAQGFFYFVDRIGDTFRWKGENVSTTEVAAVLAGCNGVVDVAVYGVSIPRTDGRAGMAALVVNGEFELALFRAQAAARLPDYARPLFVRIVTALDLTGTFKQRKQDLIEQGFDPARTADPLYFDSAVRGCYERLDAPLHQRIIQGMERL